MKQVTWGTCPGSEGWDSLPVTGTPPLAAGGGPGQDRTQREACTQLSVTDHAPTPSPRQTGVWAWGHLSPQGGISPAPKHWNYEWLHCALPTLKTALHMSPVSNGVFLAAAHTGEARNLHLKAQAWPSSCLQGGSEGLDLGAGQRGDEGELEVRGQVAFVSQGGTLEPNLWVAST